MLISLIIPNFNRKNDVINAIESVYKQIYKKFEIIIVDDHSSDGSPEAIIKKFPKVRVIALDKNQGPCVARNIGIKNAKGDIIVGMDSDVMLKDKDCFKQIINTFNQNKNVGCIAFRILNFYNKNDDVNRWWHPLPINNFCNKQFYTDFFSGTGFAFKNEVFKYAGMFPEEIFMHNEEVELSLKTLDSGYDILYDPAVVVYHNVPESETRIKHLGIREFYNKRRNQLWMVIKYYPFFKGITFIIPRIILTFFLAIKEKMLKHFFKGIYDGIRYIPRELKMRRPLQKQTWHKIKLIKKGRYFPR